MNATLHVIQKDLRYVRRPLALWLALLAAPTLVLALELDIRVTNHAAVLAVLSGAGALFYLVALVSWVLATRVVHADPLDDTSAFWITRPLGAGALLRAKLTLVFGLLAAVQVAAASFAAAANGVSGLDLLGFAAEVGLLQAIFSVLIVLLAALTRDLARLVLAIIVISIAWLALHAVSASLTTFGEPRSSIDFVPVSGLLVAAIGFCLGGLFVIRHQYLRRRTARSAVLGGLVAVGALLLAESWPVNLFAVPQPIDTRVFDPRPVKISLEDLATSRGGLGSRTKYLFAHFDAGALPPGWVAVPLQVSARLTYPDGSVAQSRAEHAAWYLLFSPGLRAAVGHAAHGTWLNEANPGIEERPMVEAGEFPADRLRKSLGKAADYDALLTLGAFQARVSATTPLGPGARLLVGEHQDTIIAVRRVAASAGPAYLGGDNFRGIEVFTRGTWPQHLFPRREPDSVYLLRNANRGEILFGVRSFDMPRSLLASVYLQVRHETLRFAGLPPSGVPVDDDWLAHAELVAVTLEEKGTFTKSIRIPRLVLREMP